MTAEEIPSSETADEGELDTKLRTALHAQIDTIFAHARTGPDVYQQCIALAGRLLELGRSAIDNFVGHNLLVSKLTAQPHALAAGEHARDDVAASVFGIDSSTVESTAKIGLLGAHVTIEQLAAFSNDPYLRGLAVALGQLRHGQLHPWLVPPKAAVHPKEHASDVLSQKVVPFCVIEYLVASGLYPTKTAARRDVLDRLDIAEDTLNDWSKQQRLHNAADFELQRSLSNFVGRQAGLFRSRVKDFPGTREWVEWYDEQYGLPAVVRCAQALKDAGAHKGQK